VSRCGPVNVETLGNLGLTLGTKSNILSFALLRRRKYVTATDTTICASTRQTELSPFLHHRTFEFRIESEKGFALLLSPDSVTPVLPNLEMLSSLAQSLKPTFCEEDCGSGTDNRKRPTD
jgi:hypothetical protein